MAPVVSVVTISDRASQGVYKDESGPRVCEVLKEYIATECEYILTCIPDEQEVIERTLGEREREDGACGERGDDKRQGIAGRVQGRVRSESVRGSQGVHRYGMRVHPHLHPGRARGD
uniref:MoaB/Mog domain-containing protein n=1 Tax=Chloropicon primus TaxID=1764295 RepID=A0A7S2T0J0_9CHLO|mmetsp:Transcript_13422/g.37705  ORF Transcript_13422/g.37705 Transcript_13422/m.37705 type:complete len:117 (+) Transcript_13422:43-393(+)